MPETRASTPSKCPFAHLINVIDTTDTHTNPEASPTTTACPVNHEQREPSNHEPRSTAAVCPLGFTSNASSSSRLSSMHCTICKSILFLPHTTPCGHTFCLHCAERSPNCVVCGATIQPGSLTSNAQLQKTLENFLDAHAGIVSFYDMYDSAEFVAALKKTPANMTNTTTTRADTTIAKATFFMTAGTVSAMGGNEMAAWHYYWLARAAYLAALNDSPGGDSNAGNVDRRELEQRLGILYGVMGDLNKSLGYDANTALTCYQRAISYLTNPSLPSNDEYLVALAAVLNKVGEVLHINGDVPTALSHYTRALDIRKERLDTSPHTPTEIRVAATLDLITSYAKVADAQGTLHLHAESTENWKRGKALLNDIDMNQARSASSHATFTALRQHFSNKNVA